MFMYMHELCAVSCLIDTSLTQTVYCSKIYHFGLFTFEYIQRKCHFPYKCNVCLVSIRNQDIRLLFSDSFSMYKILGLFSVLSCLSQNQDQVHQ